MEYERTLKIMIKNKTNNQESFKKFINKCQFEYSDSIYPDKSKYDRIDCLICGGHYTRQMKSHHEKTLKHLKGIDNLYDYITNF
jgi:hypothetical protein